MVSTNATLWSDMIFWYFPPNEAQRGVSEIGVRSYLAEGWVATSTKPQVVDQGFPIDVYVWLLPYGKPEIWKLIIFHIDG